MNVEDFNESKKRICGCTSIDEQEYINDIGSKVQEDFLDRDGRD